MSFLHLISGNNAILFMLLFSRVSSMMIFFPFFSYGTIPVSIKASFAMFMTFFLFPHAVLDLHTFNTASLFLAVVSEFLFGLIAGVILQIVFAVLGLAGEQISFVMGFSMSSAIDPMTGINSPIIGRFLMLLAVLIMLATNSHYLILIFLNNTIGKIPLGSFYPDMSVWKYISYAIGKMFVLGFVISFPVIAISLLSDIIFGMLMKTMPQFNLLVVGFPIKIALSFVVLVAVLSSSMYIFQNEFLKAITYLMRAF